MVWAIAYLGCGKKVFEGTPAPLLLGVFTTAVAGLCCPCLAIRAEQDSFIPSMYLGSKGLGEQEKYCSLPVSLKALQTICMYVEGGSKWGTGLQGAKPWSYCYSNGADAPTTLKAAPWEGKSSFPLTNICLSILSPIHSGWHTLHPHP